MTEPVIEPIYEAPVLTDGTVLLRTWRIGDRSAIAEARNDPHLSLVTHLPARYSESAATRWIERQPTNALDDKAISLAVIDLATGACTGHCGLSRVRRKRRSADTGFWTFERFRGAGRATRAVRLLVDYGFEDLELIRIQAAIEDGNVPARRVVEKAGFSFEGVLRSSRAIDGVWHDVRIYSILASDPR